jgi:hypothetical protein
MTKRYAFSATYIEQLHVWLKVHCPCSLEDPEFVNGLLVLGEEEVLRALAKERHRLYRELLRPSKQ